MISYTCLPVYLSTCLPVYLSTCLPVYLFTCLPVHLSTCLPVYLSTCLSVYLSTFLSVYLSTCLPVYLSACLPVYLSTCGNKGSSKYSNLMSPGAGRVAWGIVTIVSKERYLTKTQNGRYQQKIFNFYILFVNLQFAK